MAISGQVRNSKQRRLFPKLAVVMYVQDSTYRIKRAENRVVSRQ
jgi:hypothetical protein